MKNGNRIECDFVYCEAKKYRASKCHNTILLKIDRRVSLSNSSTEIILKCRKKRGVIFRPEYCGESMEHMICELLQRYHSQNILNESYKKTN